MKRPVPAGLEEGDSDAADVLHLDAAEAVDDVGLPHHLVEPVLDRGVAVPPALRIPLKKEKGRVSQQIHFNHMLTDYTKYGLQRTLSIFLEILVVNVYLHVLCLSACQSECTTM